MKVLGIDLGFYQVKMASDEGLYKFPSIIGYPSAIELKMKEEPISIDNLYIEDNGRMYYVGNKALRDTTNFQLTFIANKTDTVADRVKYLSMLGLALNGEKEGMFQVVTGLPVDEFAGIQGLKERLRANMEGVFQYKFGREEVMVKIPNVTVIPQSAGAYYDYIMDEEGNLITEHINPKTVIIDIGFRTTDVVTMVNAKYSPSESFTVVTGVSDIHKEIRKQLLKRYRLTKDLPEIDALVRAKTIYVGGRLIDIQSMIYEAVRPYAEKIISMLPIYIPNLHEIHQILLTGGGATLMQGFFQKGLREVTTFDMMEDVEFNNARGYYKYAKFLLKNRRKAHV